ncbi:MAG: HAD family hydrolase [Candidatus Marinimicrobia bacterium]|jgi:D,D-heptose 1,7-bisphosphate phosphatase|nr:HAD family hydrolase [Candidatus Neomarinimicrobiota bacterium]MDP6726196.1 HAD family hydrolase [Candidatus Neomarinimicrobiota bacterium]MDP7653563.1 HAD family hydrolase [Candidatus Neomarinimicrobiota bacterium]|tara:strand:- start:2928 stop:3470 length:543 start_codon:yes stop_codon:yes gene_type:complete
MKKYDTIFLDRDGTINPDPGYISDLNDFKFFPFTMDALKKMSKCCEQFCIVSNQSGIGRGLIDEIKLNEIHDYIRASFTENNLKLTDIYFCPDHPNDASKDRKPGTGMFDKAASDHGIEIKNSLMVGDAGSDMEAGAKLNMDTMLVLTGKGPETLQNLSNSFTPKFIVENLLVGAELITS